jgi:hypothetical protein
MHRLSKTQNRNRVTSRVTRIAQSLKIRSMLGWREPKRVRTALLGSPRMALRPATPSRKALLMRVPCQRGLLDVLCRGLRLTQQKRKVSGRKRWSMIVLMRAGVNRSNNVLEELDRASRRVLKPLAHPFIERDSNVAIRL